MLTDELRVQSGRDFPVFRDRDHLAWGQAWEERIYRVLDAANILVPIISPSYLHSVQCVDELRWFLSRERRLGHGGLILPIYWVDIGPLVPQANPGVEDVVTVLAERQYDDWRERRFQVARHRRKVAALAERIRDAFPTAVDLTAINRTSPNGLTTSEAAVAVDPAGANTAGTAIKISPSADAAPNSLDGTHGTPGTSIQPAIPALPTVDATIAQQYDLRPFLAQQADRLAAEDQYRQSLYVPQRITWLNPGSGRQVWADAAGQIIDALTNDGARVVALLGDAGQGKTFLLRRLAHAIPGRHPHLTPVLIDLRTLDEVRSLDELLAGHLTAAGAVRLDRAQMHYLLRAGRLVLLFDGFDELAFRMTYEKAAEHLDRLLAGAVGETKIVITGRLERARSIDEVASALSHRIALEPGSRLARLEPFSRDQILAYLANLFSPAGGPAGSARAGPGTDGSDRSDNAGSSGAVEQHAPARLAAIQAVPNLVDLVSNPRILSFVAVVESDRLRRIASIGGGAGSAGFYRKLVSDWIDIEAGRSQPPGAVESLAPADYWRTATTLAVQLWEEGSSTGSSHDLPPAATAMLAALSEPEPESGRAVNMADSGTLLTRADDGRFRFVHDSLTEYLAAVHLAPQLRRGDRPRALMLREVSPLMVEFLVAEAGQTAALDWARSVLGAAVPVGPERTNASTVARFLGELGLADSGLTPGRHENLDLSRRELSGVDLADATLVGCNVTHADLTGANLAGVTAEGCDFTGARLEGTHLANALLDHSDLTAADLTGADLTDATLVGCSLVGTVVTGSRWDGALLLGTDFDDRTSSSPELLTATVVGRDRTEVRLTPTPGAWDLAFTADSVRLRALTADGTTISWDCRTGAAAVLDTAPPLAIDAAQASCVTLAPGGEWGAGQLAGRVDGQLQVVDLTTGACRAMSSVRPTARALAFSPDAQLVAGGGDDEITVWTASTGEPVAHLAAPPGGVRAIGFHHGGALLAAGGPTGELAVWEATTGTLRASVTATGGDVVSLAFAPDGRLAVLHQDGQVELVNLLGRGADRTLAGSVGAAGRLCVSPDGALLAAGGEKGLLVWDLADGSPRARLSGHTGRVSAVTFSPDGELLASAGDDGTIRLWSLRPGQQSKTEGTIGCAVLSLACHPDGSRIATGGVSVQIWPATADNPMEQLDEGSPWVRSVAYSPDGRILAWGGDDGEAYLGRAARPPDAGRTQASLAAGPRQRLKRHGKPVRAVAFSPDGTRLATASEDGTVRHWDTITGAEVGPTIRTPWALAIAYTPDGRRLATGGSDGRVRIWDAVSGRQLTQQPSRAYWVRAVSFSPDGALLASGGDDGMVRLWNGITGEELALLPGHTQAVACVAFSPDGTRLASGGQDGTIRIWDLEGGPDGARELAVLRGHVEWVWSIAFTPDGTRLVSGGSDGTVRRWRLPFAPDATLVHLPPDGWAVLRPDGSYKLRGNSDGRLWWSVRQRRFGPGELDGYLPALRRLPEDLPLP